MQRWQLASGTCISVGCLPLYQAVWALCLLMLLAPPPPPPARLQLKGMCTNLEFLRVIAASPRYAAGETTTKFVEMIDYAPHAGEESAWQRQTVVARRGRSGISVASSREPAIAHPASDEHACSRCAVPCRHGQPSFPLSCSLPRPLAPCSRVSGCRAADDGAGLPRPSGAVERGRAALWTHGRPLPQVNVRGWGWEDKVASRGRRPL